MGKAFAQLRAQAWVWDLDGITHGEQLVLLALSGFVNEDFECWPSQVRLALMTKMTRTSVSRSIKSLVSKGLVSTLKLDGRGSLTYTLHVEGGGGGVAVEHTPEPVAVEHASERTVSPTGTGGVAVEQHELPVEHTEQSKNKLENKETFAPAKPARKRDLLFEALVEVTGLRLDKLTGTERGRINKATKDLREVGADPAEVLIRAKTYKQMYPNVPLTAMALAGNWGKLERRKRHAVEDEGPCPNCGVTEKHHQIFVHCGR